MKSGCAIAFAIAGLFVPLASFSAHAGEIKVFASTALKSVLQEVGPQFGEETGTKLDFTFGPAAEMKRQIDQGAGFDVAVLTDVLMDDLVKAGKVDAATRATVARVGLGIAVHAGAAKPNVRTADAFKQALLTAKSVGYNGVGASRAWTEAVFQKLGIADALKPKIKLLSIPAAAAVAKGEVELGLGPISEILSATGAQLAGPFPADLQSYLVFAAGASSTSKNLSAAKLLIDYFKSPAAAPVLKTKGMEPG